MNCLTLHTSPDASFIGLSKLTDCFSPHFCFSPHQFNFMPTIVFYVRISKLIGETCMLAVYTDQRLHNSLMHDGQDPVVRWKIHINTQGTSQALLLKTQNLGLKHLTCCMVVSYLYNLFPPPMPLWLPAYIPEYKADLMPWHSPYTSNALSKIT